MVGNIIKRLITRQGKRETALRKGKIAFLALYGSDCKARKGESLGSLKLHLTPIEPEPRQPGSSLDPKITGAARLIEPLGRLIEVRNMI
jgi:hypothetical protein